MKILKLLQTCNINLSLKANYTSMAKTKLVPIDFKKSPGKLSKTEKYDNAVKDLEAKITSKEDAYRLLKEVGFRALIQRDELF